MLEPRTTAFIRALAIAALLVLACGCREKAPPLVAKSQTFAELRTIKRGVRVFPPGEAPREPYRRDRLVDGEVVELAAGGLAWLRRDGGATLLVAGPGSLTLRADSIEIKRGKVFVDTPPGATTELSTPRGPLHLSAVRTSIQVDEDGSLSAYVLRGAVRAGTSTQAEPGERLTIDAKGRATTAPVVVWEDWTGGLATTDSAPAPAPYGVGTVGARKPGELGSPRFPLSIQRMDVKVTIEDEFATTEVEQIFANPTGETVEGLYSFRTPEGATLGRFGVDRDGELVWGRVKEKEAAAAQYQAHVYEGSTEDPALLVWDSPGVYKARLYPIEPRATRRVVTRYGEWLGRHGSRGERRLYVYPMAAEGAEGTLPRIEELTITLDLSRANAKDVRVGMQGKQVGSTVTVKAHDVVPRADFAVELYDHAPPRAIAYRSTHAVDRDTTQADQVEQAERMARGEAPYVLVPVRPSRANEPEGGLDFAIVVDTSAATDSGALSIARAMTRAVLSHLGPDDRAAIWAGDATLRAVADGSDRFAPMDAKRREAVATGLAHVERGGATDLGAIVADAASRLDAMRRGAVVYIGDGQPTVGERALPALRERLGRLPRPTRLFAVGVGDAANMGVLEGIARGGFAVRVGDAYTAALAALRVLEEAERPAWLGATVDLGPGVDRVFPRELGTLVADESAIVIGRVAGDIPKRVVVRGPGGEIETPLVVKPLRDGGDLQRRWAEGRLAQLLDEGAGRAAVVEIGVRSGVITPYTSLYVPTADEHRREMEAASRMLAARDDGTSWWDWLFGGSRGYDEAPMLTSAAVPVEEADNTEGGTGTRAKGEEGSMGAAPKSGGSGKRYAVRGPKDDRPVELAPDEDAELPEQQALREAQEMPTSGIFPEKKMEAPAAASPPEPEPASPPVQAAESAPTAAKLGAIGSLGHGASGGGLARLGGGGGALDATKKTMGPRGNATMAGAVVSGGSVANADRVVASMRAGFRACYNRALAGDPDAQGRIHLVVRVGPGGEVGDATAAPMGNLPESVIGCVTARARASRFDAPEGGATTITVPVTFTREGGGDFEEAVPEPKKPPAPIAQPVAGLGAIGHSPVPCLASADLPLEERRILWRERLAGAGSNVEVVAQVYLGALRGCEAPTWRERSLLLLLAVDALVTVELRVQLWRRFEKAPAVADAIYRAILTRVQTAAQIRELHAALGIKTMDRSLLARLLREKKSPEERAALLRGLVDQWPDDLELALDLLYALEDAGDDGGGRALARRLRRRSDATTRVRTAVGEYYLRLGTKNEASGARDVTEARRTFGEIVEFAPDDPQARRLLGDLLRAHGWFEEALRQYETLARLTPDDTSVPLLIAASAAGLGRTEEAVQWTEKAAAAGSPDPTSPTAKTARSYASVFLAWARLEAERAGRKAEAARLRERARRLAAVDVPEKGTVRVVLTWAHPEVRAELWSSALGAPMPAADGDPAVGIAETAIAASRARDGVEIRLSEEEAQRAARLHAEAVLTAITDEGTESEKIAKLLVRFERKDGGVTPRRSFRVENGALTEEAVR